MEGIKLKHTMTKKIIKGEKYWRLTIVKEVFWRERRYVECKCDCWEIRDIRISSVLNKITSSCWCLVKDIRKSEKTHWMKWTKIYSVWSNMKSRCVNKEHKAYSNYWWRGITICNSWNSFEEFYKDMWEIYSEWLQIDRIDNNWNYCKENCRWVTAKENCRNTRKNVLYKWKCIAQWCEELKLNYQTVFNRIYKWISIKEALNI